MQSTLSIGEVARRTGINTSAVRYYERQGLLPAPRRVSGQRRYDPAILERIKIILTSKQLGFTLDEIRGLLAAAEQQTSPADTWRHIAANKLPTVEAQIQQLEMTRTLLLQGSQCTCESVQQCLATYDGTSGATSA